MPSELFIVAGDSFVRRLDYMMQSNRHAHRSFRPNFGLAYADVEMAGLNGTDKIVYLRHVEQWVEDNREKVSDCQVFCIQVGSNDLLERFFNRGEELAVQVMYLARRIWRIGAQRIVILPVMFRQGAAAIPRRSGQFGPEARNSARIQYNYSVMDFNRAIRKLCSESTMPISCTEPKGLRRSWGRHLQDGCHYNIKAYRKYYRNTRNTLIAEGLKCWPL